MPQQLKALSLVSYTSKNMEDSGAEGGWNCAVPAQEVSEEKNVSIMDQRPFL